MTLRFPLVPCNQCQNGTDRSRGLITHEDSPHRWSSHVILHHRTTKPKRIVFGTTARSSVKAAYSAATSLYLTGHVGCMELLNKDLHLYLRGHVSLVGGWFSPLSTDLWFVKPFPVPTCSFPQYVSYADILCKTQNTRSNTERECEKLSWDTTYIITYYIYCMELPALPPK